MDAFATLLGSVRACRFEPHDIRGQLDRTGRYEIQLPAEFPFVIKLFRYSSRQHTRGLTWHERLELFVPLDGPAHVRMGDQVVQLAGGDVLVVDNLKLHSVVDFPGFDTRVMVVSFLPEFVYSLGSPSHDYAFLLPFYAKMETQPHILRRDDASASAFYEALAHLVDCYFHRAQRRYFESGCKAHFLVALHHLAQHFQSSEILRSEFLRQQQRAQRLQKVLDWISHSYAEKLSLSKASSLAGLSLAQFIRLFKKVAGMSFVAYVTHVRLTRAVQLLKEGRISIAEVAHQVGFSDQSYFDRRFKRAYGQSPSQFQSSFGLGTGSVSRRT